MNRTRLHFLFNVATVDTRDAQPLTGAQLHATAPMPVRLGQPESDSKQSLASVRCPSIERCGAHHNF